MGFDGRVFLLKSERDTYLRRMPVRFIHKSHSDACHLCNLPGTPDNPLQHSHLIGFAVGIRKYGLTPDFLDSPTNIVSAHRRTCNKAVELTDAEIEALLATYQK